MTEEQLTEAATQLFDACVNPLASIICSFLALQVQKGAISKDEAKYLIASSADVLNHAEVSDDVRNVGANMLMRMIRAVDQLQTKQ